MGFKKVLKKIGKVALKAAPIAAAFIPGVGPLAAMGLRAGIGALSGAASGGGLKGALIGGGLGAIPGGGAGSVAGGAAKVGLKEIAKGVAKGAATNFAAGTGTGLVTGQGLKNSLVGGANAATAGGTATGGLGAAAKAVGKNVAVNAGGTLAAKGLQKAGVPGAAAQQGGNVFSNYLGNQFNKPAVTPTNLVQGTGPTAGFGASPRPTGAATPAAGGGVKGALKAGLGALATGYVNPGNPSGTMGTTLPDMRNPTGPTSTGSHSPVVNGRVAPTTGPNAPTGQTSAAGDYQAPTTPADPNKPASWSERYGPLIVQGAGVAAGALLGRQATKNAQQRSPEEQAALTGATGAAGDLSTGGRQAWQRGNQLQEAPGQYFQTLLSGNRAAMSQAIAAPAAQITGNYRGAQRALDQQGVRGAARDVAVGDLNRDRVSKIAGLTTGMQPYAAEQLTSMGQQQQALAPGMMQGAGNIYGGLLGQGANNRAYARQEGEKTATAIGGLARDVGEVVFKPKPAGATPVPETKTQNGTATAPPPVGAGPQTPVAPSPVQAPGGVAVPPSTFPGKVKAPNFGVGPWKPPAGVATATPWLTY